MRPEDEDDVNRKQGREKKNKINNFKRENRRTGTAAGFLFKVTQGIRCSAFHRLENVFMLIIRSFEIDMEKKKSPLSLCLLPGIITLFLGIPLVAFSTFLSKDNIDQILSHTHFNFTLWHMRRCPRQPGKCW